MSIVAVQTAREVVPLRVVTVNGWTLNGGHVWDTDVGAASPERVLNRAGAEGWELISVIQSHDGLTNGDPDVPTDHPGRTFVYYMRRRRRAERAAPGRSSTTPVVGWGALPRGSPAQVANLSALLDDFVDLGQTDPIDGGEGHISESSSASSDAAPPSRVDPFKRVQVSPKPREVTNGDGGDTKRPPAPSTNTEPRQRVDPFRRTQASPRQPDATSGGEGDT